MIDLKEFEEVVEKLDKNKWHINRCVMFNENGPYLAEWSIFRKKMDDFMEYFHPDNLAVLSSAKENTIEDIKELIEKENEK